MAKKKEIEKEEKLNRLLDILDKKKMSQYKLHKDSGISYSLVNDYCLNKRQPGLKQLKVLSKALEVPGKDLINF